VRLQRSMAGLNDLAINAKGYALSQIEQLTPQALTILADHPHWPKMVLQDGYSSNGGKITSDWLPAFARAYASSKNIDEKSMADRVAHSIHELINRRLIEARLAGNFGDSSAQCILTDVGQSLIPYLSKSIDDPR
jgi:hypothetical protein